MKYTHTITISNGKKIKVMYVKTYKSLYSLPVKIHYKSECGDWFIDKNNESVTEILKGQTE